MDNIYTALETSRQGLNQGLAVVTGDEPEMLGAPVAGETAPIGAAAQVAGAPAPNFGGAAPGEEQPGSPEELASAAPDAGRMKRESVEYSRKLGMMLSSKKK
jgi:hypothetical protein